MSELRRVIEKYRTYWVNSNGVLHRVDGPAVEWTDGSKEWYLYGKRHRVDGPAVAWKNGIKEWFVNGKYHRVDGPAIEYRSGRKDWFINGEEFSSQEAWFKALSRECQIDYLFKMEGLK